MATDIDLHLGRRLRRRRRLLGLTQQQLALKVGIRFQQIQKYECGANRISAARLWELAEALETPVSYFYDGLAEALERKEAAANGDSFSRKETLDLIQAYYQLSERPRRRLLDLAKSLNADEAPAFPQLNVLALGNISYMFHRGLIVRRIKLDGRAHRRSFRFYRKRPVPQHVPPSLPTPATLIDRAKPYHRSNGLQPSLQRATRPARARG